MLRSKKRLLVRRTNTPPTPYCFRKSAEAHGGKGVAARSVCAKSEKSAEEPEKKRDDSQVVIGEEIDGRRDEGSSRWEGVKDCETHKACYRKS
jgi:hypothetical protein